MPEAGFHLAQPWWLLGLLLILPVASWLRRSAVHGFTGRINRYADAHLLPHLTGSRELQPRERWRRFARWALLWSLLCLAMAGPRWSFEEIKLYTPGADLVVLLDISRSMEVPDEKPTRLGRARQELEDLINQARGLRIGIVAFASVAHVIAPITEDAAALRSKLPILSTDMVTLQGSRLTEALDRARHLLAGQPKEAGHSILLISDGDFAERGLEEKVRELAGQNIRVHTMGVGTPEGAPVPAPGGGWLHLPNREIVQSRLNEETLKLLAEDGKGVYIRAGFRDDDTREILRLAVEHGTGGERKEETAFVWNERFDLILILVALLMLPAFRRLAVLKEEG